MLLHDATPNGTWIAETKLHLDLGENEVRNFQQAGLIAYENDDDFARLSSVAIWNTRQTEFGRELDGPADPDEPDHLRRRDHRHPGRDDLAAAGPHPQPGRGAPVPGRHQPGRPELDLGRGVDLRRRHRPARSA